MMYRPLEITIISAKDLKDVGHFSKMDVYIAVTVSGDHRTEQKTPVDKDGGSSPSWNYTMNFAIDEAAAQMNRLNLIFQLRHHRTLLGDKDVGEVHVPVKELLGNASGDGKSAVFAEYLVRNPSGKAKGKLEFSYKFGAVYEIDKVNVHAHAGTSSIYPPPVKVDPNTPPAGYPSAQQFPLPPPQAGDPPPTPVVEGYGYLAYGGYYQPLPPPPPPFGYAPLGPGYGFPPPVQPPKKHRHGSGLGPGTVGALIGGMMIAEGMSDSGS